MLDTSETNLTAETWTYGASSRPVGFAAVPKGHVAIGTHPDFTFGSVTYRRALSRDEQNRYGLTLIPTDEQRARFVQFVVGKLSRYHLAYIQSGQQEFMHFALGVGSYIDRARIHLTREPVARDVLAGLVAIEEG